MQCVGIFRHPQAVADSLTHRNLFSREQGLGLWCHYNRRLLACYRRQPFPVLYFSEQPDEFCQQLERLIAWLGLDRPQQGFQFFEPELQHQRAGASATAG